MKCSVSFGVVAALFLLTTNCTQEVPTGSSQGSGGSGGKTTGSGGTSASGGATGSGGSGSGGVSGGSGGQTESGTGGASSGGVGAGGAAGGGGATAKGGATGSGGATTGKGGTTGTGGSATGGSGSGGATTGKGGAAGGGATGQGGAAGSGGTTSGGGSTGGLTPADIVPDLDGFYWEGTCSGNVSVSGKNCPLYDNGATTCASGTSWADRGTIRNKTIKVIGTSGTQYTINFEVRGVVGARCYTGGKAAVSSASSVTGQNNWWYAGGTPSSTGDIWNTYELHVDPPVSGEANVYYFNAAQPSPDWCQKEASYEVKYSASFKVMGGGTMKFTVHDSNCQAQQNCGSNEGSSSCDSPRGSIDLSGMTPAATFKQPPTNAVGTKTYYPQWLYFDVKSVTSP
jgi:hypothetical protein